MYVCMYVYNLDCKNHSHDILKSNIFYYLVPFNKILNQYYFKIIFRNANIIQEFTK